GPVNALIAADNPPTAAGDPVVAAVAAPLATLNLPNKPIIEDRPRAIWPNTISNGPIAAAMPAITMIVFCIVGDKLLNQSANPFTRSTSHSRAGRILSYIVKATSSNADFLS